MDGAPTYFTSLKDKAGLVKVYALVSAEHYGIVGYANTLEGMEKAIANYKLALEGKPFSSDVTTETPDSTTESTVQEVIEEVNFSIEELQQIVVDGTTSYYVKSGNKVYIVPITTNPSEFFNLKIGDQISGTAALKEDYYLIKKFSINEPLVISKDPENTEN